jgi:hypothetical protein
MKPIDGIYPTLHATFPRSGCILVRRVLGTYFGDSLHWTDIHKWAERGFDQDPKCNMEKNHDFDLKCPIRTQRLHLVQFRNPFDALPGWKAAKEVEGMKLDNWRPWFRERTQYWSKFVNKWVFSPVPNRLVVTYEKLTANPVYVMTRIITFMTKKAPDMDKLIAAVEAQNIKPRKPKPVDYELV